MLTIFSTLNIVDTLQFWLRSTAIIPELSNPILSGFQFWDLSQAIHRRHCHLQRDVEYGLKINIYGSYRVRPFLAKISGVVYCGGNFYTFDI